MPTDRPAGRRPLPRRLMESVFARLTPGAREQLTGLVERRYEEITYRRLAGRGFRPGGLIDIGAFRGDWTRMARSIFGRPPALMIEAQAALVPGLKAFAKEQPGLACVHALLGRETGREKNDPRSRGWLPRKRSGTNISMDSPSNSLRS